MTLADLDAMFEARRVEEWERTAFLATYAANANPIDGLNEATVTFKRSAVGAEESSD